MSLEPALPRPEAAPHDATIERLRRVWFRKAENLRLALREFSEKKAVLESLPAKAIVELTQNCNFRCVMCPQSFEERFSRYHPEYNMSLETFARIGEQLFPTALFVDLRGFGESTIYPQWAEVVDYLEDFPFTEWYLVTNLSLPRDEIWRQMMRLGFTLGFSCDAASKEIFESIRVRSRFDRIVHNLGVIQDAIRSSGKGYIHFISTIQRANMQELRGIVELAHRFDVDEVQFKVAQSSARFTGLLPEDCAPMREFVDQALDAAIDLGVRVTFNDWLFTKLVDAQKVAQAARYRPRRNAHPFPGAPPGSGPETPLDLGPDFQRVTQASQVSLEQKCFKPYSFTYINYRAEMGTCNHMMYPDMLVMGDLQRDGLREVWNSVGYVDFRRQLTEARPSDPRCQWCFQHRLDD